jgi:hypothetical protein
MVKVGRDRERERSERRKAVKTHEGNIEKVRIDSLIAQDE